MKRHNAYGAPSTERKAGAYGPLAAYSDVYGAAATDRINSNVYGGGSSMKLSIDL